MGIGGLQKEEDESKRRAKSLEERLRTRSGQIRGTWTPTASGRPSVENSPRGSAKSEASVDDQDVRNMVTKARKLAESGQKSAEKLPKEDAETGAEVPQTSKMMEKAVTTMCSALTKFSESMDTYRDVKLERKMVEIHASSPEKLLNELIDLEQLYAGAQVPQTKAKKRWWIFRSGLRGKAREICDAELHRLKVEV